MIVVELAYSLCGDDVISLRAVKLGYTLNDHVVALSCSACKNDVLGLSTNDTGDCLRVIPRNVSILRCSRRIPNILLTARASSTAASASQPYAWVLE